MGPVRRTRSALQEFVAWEASGGFVLLVATVVGLLWANLHADSYHDVWESTLTLGAGPLEVSEHAREWVNEALMTLFFFVVGLEIKRELVVGELREPRAAALPVLAAVGGMVVPAGIFLALNLGTEHAGAWGVPVATDIAFVLGVLAVLGRRAPAGLKLFLLALAIVDDLGGILVIAVFYVESLSVPDLLGALVVTVGVALMRRRVAAIPVYVACGVVLWYLMHKSGVHATLAGVALGLLTPAREVRGRDVLCALEHRLVPWSAFVAVPAFALANAGVELSWSVLADAFESRVVWGVVLGLVAGKALGITAFALGAVRMGWARLPRGARPLDIFGGAVLAGIGFTVALFIAGLSLADEPEVLAHVKAGILIASASAAVLGSAVLVITKDDPVGSDEDPDPVQGGEVTGVTAAAADGHEEL